MENHPTECNVSLLATQNGQTRENMEPVDARFFLRKRYFVIIFIIISYMVITLVGANFILFMTKMASNQTKEVDNQHVEKNEPHWTSLQMGLIMSSMSLGGLLSPLGGLLATRFGGIKSLSSSILGTGLITISYSVIMKQQLLIIVIVGFFEGLVGGVFSASQGEILYHWTPPGERTFLANMSILGSPLGLIFCFPLAGYLQQILHWETTFYITGGVAITWAILLVLFIGESPVTDNLITKVERDYFKGFNMIEPKVKVVHPWKQMLKSVPLWALLNERFVESWSSSFIAMCFPLFFRDVYKVNIQDLGWISSIPYYFLFCGKIPAALLADYLRRNNIWSQTTVHKVYILLAQIAAVVLLVTAGFVNNFLISLIIFCLFRLCFTLAFISYSILPLDIGARHSSFIFGLCSTSTEIGYTLNPLVIGFMITNHTFSEWSRYFFFLASFNAWAAIIFAFYGSGELQSWAKPPEAKEPEDRIEAAHSS